MMWWRRDSAAGGFGDEWVTQMLRRADAKVFKKYSRMELQIKREALEKINRYANVEQKGGLAQLWFSFGLEKRNFQMLGSEVV